MNNLWFRTHWLLGIIPGAVLAVMGVTGAALSFEHEWLRLLNPQVMTVTPQAQGPLSPDALAARIRAQAPQRRISSLTVYAAPGESARVSFAAPGGRRSESVYVNPYTGALLGKAERGDRFLHLMEDVHRRLGADDLGKALTGASTVCLIVLALSGLYLRWPRRALNWRAWLSFNTRLKGRSFLVGMHSVLGTWVLLPYLVMSATGLFWSYDWYRNGLYALAGAPMPQQRPGGASGARDAREEDSPAPPVFVDLAFAAFQREVPAFAQYTVNLSRRGGEPVQFAYLAPDAPHERAYNRLNLAADGSAVISHERHRQKTAGARLLAGVFPLHSGEFFGTAGLLAFMLSSLLMPLFAITGWMLYLDRRGKKRRARKQARKLAAAPP